MFDFYSTPYGDREEKSSNIVKESSGIYNDYIEISEDISNGEYIKVKFLDDYSYKPFVNSRGNRPQYLYSRKEIENLEFPEKTVRTKGEIINEIMEFFDTINK